MSLNRFRQLVLSLNYGLVSIFEGISYVGEADLVGLKGDQINYYS
jgi:hypothetical protein